MYSNWNSRTLLLGCKMAHSLCKIVWQYLIKLNIHLPRNSTPRHLATQEKSKQMATQTCMQIFTAALFKIVKNWMEITQMSMKWWMDKQITVYSYNGILSYNKKEQTTDIHHMDESQKHHIEWKKQDTKDCSWFHLYEMRKGDKKQISSCSGVGVGKGNWM